MFHNIEKDIATKTFRGQGLFLDICWGRETYLQGPEGILPIANLKIKKLLLKAFSVQKAFAESFLQKLLDLFLLYWYPSSPQSPPNMYPLITFCPNNLSFKKIFHKIETDIATKIFRG